MPWFNRPKPPGPSPDGRFQGLSEAEQVRDRELLEQGQLPAKAAQRVVATREGQLPWMSTFSVPETALADLLHLTPIAQVTGSSYFHAATDQSQRIFLDDNFDAANLIRAYYRAKSDALGRLVEEARLAGAHAVIDTRIQFTREGTVVTCSLVGTAVSFGPTLRPPRTPLVSPLTGEDFYRLWSRGYMPVTWAVGYYRHVMPVGYRTRSITSGWNFWNQEVTGVTERLSEVRRYAVQQMLRDARDSGQRVDGLVGVTIRTAVEETEILMMAGYGAYGFGGGVTIDGTFYPYDNGRAEIPAYSVEFLLSGAGIARIASVPLAAKDIQSVLAGLP